MGLGDECSTTDIDVFFGVPLLFLRSHSPTFFVAPVRYTNES